MTSLAMSVILQAAMLGGGSTQVDQYAAAYAQSVRTGRPLVVLLGAEWCPGCRKMKGHVMPEVARAGVLRNVEYVYVDIDRHPELASQLSRSKSIPQLLRFTPTRNGWRSGLLTGAHSPKKVASFIKAGVIRTAPASQTAARLSSWDEPLPNNQRR